MILARFLRQPIVHFALIGLAIFGLFALVDDSAPQPERPLIEVSQQDARLLAAQFKATWRRPPTEAELSGLIDEFVRDEIYVREALSLGLDQGDTIVRRRLRQKMEFLTEAGASAAPVDEATLRAYLDENADKFKRPARVAFAQILMPDEAGGTRDALLAELTAGADPQTLGQRTLLPAQVPLNASQAVDGVFGKGFFDAVSALEPGVWSGPVRSGYGAHLVRVDRLQQAELPPFDDLRDRLEVAWRADMAARLRTDRLAQLTAKYTVVRPAPAAVPEK